MKGVDEVELPLRSPAGTKVGTVRIVLPFGANSNIQPAPLIDLRGDPINEPGVEPIQVLEGREYRFEIITDDGGHLFIEPAELFSPDDATMRVGRFRPGLRTGTVPVKISNTAGLVGIFAVEVRSRKFDYRAHYRWMLRDLTETMTEIVMERFAAAEQRFTIDDQRDAVTLYQRFALLRSLLADDYLQGALYQIISRPYVTWQEEREIRLTAQGVRSSSQMMRQLTRHGARRKWDGGHRRLPTIPRRVAAVKSYSTHDNGANRFVKFALIRWRNIIAHIHDILLNDSRPSSPIRRGIAEVADLRDKLDAFLSEELFREVGSLAQVPASSQVLQKRSGYRAVYQTYIQFELASKLSWAADDVYGAGQRDVATLYEYWTFLQIVEIVASLCERDFDTSSLFTVQNDGLSIGLKSGEWQVFEGIAQAKGGRRMKIELHFNKTFGPNDGSWTRSMRPDCSLCIRPVADEILHEFEEVWLHFDAKYRVDTIRQILSDEDDEAEVAGEHDGLISGQAKREDLLKMHAYRDAIRRSAGAYVLYPGNQTQRLREFHELLPGLGAFPLCPTDTGTTGGGHMLKAFIEDVIDHVASQLTQHERGRYWRGKSFEEKKAHFLGGLPELPPASFLPRPPADTLVLLGFVKNQAHMTWIRERRLYNLRADRSRDGSVGLGSREIAADLIVLYGPALDHGEVWHIGGEPRLVDSAEMMALGYPKPRGEQYFVLPVAPTDDERWGGRLSFKFLMDLQAKLGPDRAYGAPVVTSWLQVAGEISGAV